MSAIPAAPAAVTGLRDRWRSIVFESRRALGWPGAVGLALAVIGIALLGTVSPALHLEANQFVSRAAANREQRAAQRVEQLNAPSGAQVVQHFVEGFPALTSQVDDLAFLVQQAAGSGVQLARADYQLRNEPALGLVRYQVNLPVQARYATLRSFIAAVLNARPNASLDELALERKDGEMIDARVRFTFVYRSGDVN